MNDGAGNKPPESATPAVTAGDARANVGSSLMGRLFLIVLVIALIRMLDVYLPGDVWSAYLLLGVVFSMGGLLVWRRRYAPEVP